MVALLILQFAMPKPLEAALFSLSPSVRQEGGVPRSICLQQVWNRGPFTVMPHSRPPQPVEFESVANLVINIIISLTPDHSGSRACAETSVSL